MPEIEGYEWSWCLVDQIPEKIVEGWEILGPSQHPEKSGLIGKSQHIMRRKRSSREEDRC